MKKTILFTLVCLITCMFLTGCKQNQQSNNNDNTHEIIDLMNRQVTLKKDIEKVICIGAGSLRLYSYVADMNKLSGVELIEKTSSPMQLPKRPYQVLYQELLDKLPQCGIGGPKGQQADTESILKCNPDVVFSTIKDVDAMNKITKDTNVPVVILNYGKKGAFETLEEANQLKKSINLIGKVMNRNERATEINNYILNIITDISNRTQNISDVNKPLCYLGALGNFGMHGLNSSQAKYPLLEIANIKNVLDDLGLTNVKEADIDKEILNSINPEYVFIDAGGINKTKVQINDVDDPLSKIYKNWQALKENKTFVVLPYKVYFMQIENGLIDAYYIAKTVYQEEFKDIDITKKAKEIFTFFYGNNFYDTYLKQSNLEKVVFKNFVYE